LVLGFSLHCISEQLQVVHVCVHVPAVCYRVVTQKTKVVVCRLIPPSAHICYIVDYTRLVSASIDPFPSLYCWNVQYSTELRY